MAFASLAFKSVEKMMQPLFAPRSAWFLLAIANLFTAAEDAPAKKIKILLVGDSTVTVKAGWCDGFA